MTGARSTQQICSFVWVSSTSEGQFYPHDAILIFDPEGPVNSATFVNREIALSKFHQQFIPKPCIVSPFGTFHHPVCVIVNVYLVDQKTYVKIQGKCSKYWTKTIGLRLISSLGPSIFNYVLFTRINIRSNPDRIFENMFLEEQVYHTQSTSKNR